MKNELGFLDLLLLIVKDKKLVIWMTLLSALLAIGYSLITPKYWKSTAIILPVSDSEGLGSFSTNLMDIAGGGFLKTPKSEQAIDFIAVMKSRSFREKVVNEFNLIKYFKITNPDPAEAMELAVKGLGEKVLKTSFDEESYLVSVTAETRSKQLSLDIARFCVNQLASYNQNNRMSKGRQKREFLQTQVESNMREADSLAKAIRDFQIKNKAIAIDKQTESLVSLYSDQAAAYMQSEIEYDLAKKQYSETSPVVLNLADRLKVQSQKLGEIESSNTKLVPKYLLQIDTIPDLSMQYAQLMINVEIKKKVIEYIYPQFELAKLEELKDLPTFEIIDPPQLPGLRSKPRRAIIVVLVTIAAFLMACVAVLIKEFVFTQNKAKVNEIIRTLFNRK